MLNLHLEAPKENLYSTIQKLFMAIISKLFVVLLNHNNFQFEYDQNGERFVALSNNQEVAEITITNLISTNIKKEIIDGVYITKRASELVINRQPITSEFKHLTFKVVAIGKQDKIKIRVGALEFQMDNPFISNLYGEVVDRRDFETMYAFPTTTAHNEVLDMTGVRFDLSPVEMGRLRNRLYMFREDTKLEWVELNESNKAYLK